MLIGLGMKRLSPRHAGLALLLAACGPEPVGDAVDPEGAAAFAGAADGLRPEPAPGVLAPPSRLADGFFTAVGAAGKCLDFGAAPATGQTVRLQACNGSAAQRVHIVEQDTSHEVQLRAGELCIAPYRGLVVAGLALELQACASSTTQRWLLDGDSIRPASARVLTVVTEAGRTADGTPLVLGERRYDDWEQWTLQPLAAGQPYPTTGFRPVSTAEDLKRNLEAARPNEVVVVASGVTLNLSAYQDLPLHADVTLRGDRRGVEPGPRLDYPTPPAGDSAMLVVDGDRARVTGLRLHGPSPSPETSLLDKGVEVPRNRTAVVDHCELSAWPGAGVSVSGGVSDEVCSAITSRSPRVLVTRNYIHANRRDERGYGVVTGSGGYARIDGNVFSGNRHASAGDGRAKTRYHAHHNLVLTSAPTQDLGNHTHDFDMHGRESSWGIDYWQGVAGEETRIERNTFLATNRLNFRLRGDPCYRGFFLDNVSLESQGDAVTTNGASSGLEVRGNRFSAEDPTRRLAVGDFDGDGHDDLFLATGTAFYVSYRGQTEWRLLRRGGEALADLRIGDFDGDGRADLLKATPAGMFTSWGGQSDWDRTSTVVAPIADLLVGRFRDPGRADVFYADGAEWRLLRGARGSWEHYATSGFRVANVRLGDFDNDGRTDVLGVVGGNWAYVPGNGRSWTTLRAAPIGGTVIDQLVVADFDGDGRADVVRQLSDRWVISSGGRAEFAYLSPLGLDYKSAPIGRFDGTAGVDVAQVSSLGVRLLSAGRAPYVTHSDIEMH